jgi:hypothetical protein
MKRVNYEKFILDGKLYVLPRLPSLYGAPIEHNVELILKSQQTSDTSPWFEIYKHNDGTFLKLNMWFGNMGFADAVVLSEETAKDLIGRMDVEAYERLWGNAA